MAWARASGLDRVIACPASTVLPRGSDERSEAAKEAAEWGTLMHHFMASGQVPKHRLREKVLARAQYLPRKKLWPLGGAFETAFSLNVTNWNVTSILGSEGADAWKESQPWACITGSADYVSQGLFRPWVDDLKTGRRPADPGEPQTLFYGLCLWLLAGKPDSGVDVSITAFPRYPLVGDPTRKFKELSVRDLTEFQSVLTFTFAEVCRLKAQHAGLVKIGKRDVTPNDGCGFCPAATTCPLVGPRQV